MVLDNSPEEQTNEFWIKRGGGSTTCFKQQGDPRPWPWLQMSGPFVAFFVKPLMRGMSRNIFGILKYSSQHYQFQMSLKFARFDLSNLKPRHNKSGSAWGGVQRACGAKTSLAGQDADGSIFPGDSTACPSGVRRKMS